MKLSGVRWFKSDPVYSHKFNVDTAAGVIRNISVCSIGEAKGHNVWIEGEFLSDLVTLGNQAGPGIKCRFGHPNMSTEALGTYLGRFKNFRVSGDKALADLFLDPVAQSAPGGDLYSYVLEMADRNPDMFGASIVFNPDGYYYYDEEGNKVDGWAEKTFVRIRELFAADVVDEPAANSDGLFSARFNNEKYAVIVTNFLDKNPQIWEYLSSNPAKLQPFFQHYAEYQRKIKTEKKMKKEKPKPKGFFGRLAAALLQQEQYSNIDATTDSGDSIRIVAQGDTPAVDDAVYIVQDDGSETPAPDDDYTITSGDFAGMVISVADGVITAVRSDASSGADDGSNPAFNKGQRSPALLAENKRLKDQLSATRAELERYKKNPLEPHTEVVSNEDLTGVKSATDEAFWSKPWNAKHRK